VRKKCNINRNVLPQNSWSPTGIAGSTVPPAVTRNGLSEEWIRVVR